MYAAVPFLFNPPNSKNNNKKEIDSALLLCCCYWNLKRNFFGRAIGAAAVYIRGGAAQLSYVGWCHPVSRQTRTRASPIQQLHVRQAAGGGGWTRSQRDPTWPPFLLAPLVPTIQKAIATPSSEDDQILHERTGKKTTKWKFICWIWYLIHREIITSHYDFCNCVSVWCGCVRLCCSGQCVCVCVCKVCVCVCVDFLFETTKKEIAKKCWAEKI